MGNLIYKHVVVPQPGPLSLYIKLELLSIEKLDLCFPYNVLWMDFKGPCVHGQGFWPMGLYKIC